jgi:hypothetical protein
VSDRTGPVRPATVPGAYPEPVGEPVPADAPDRRIGGTAWIAVAIAVAIGATLVAVLASLSGNSGQRTPAGPAPGVAIPTADRVATGARNGKQEAEFHVISGANSITVRAVDLGDTLYRVSSPGNGALVPTVVDNNNGPIELSLGDTGIAGPATVDVLLNSAVRWRLRLAGGGTQETVDFTGGQLAGVEFVAGAGKIEVTLPAPRGLVPVRLGGGAGELAVHVATGAPTRVRVAGTGAGTVTVDGRTQRGVAGGASFAPAGWEKAADRYDIELAAGVATVTVDRR